MQEDDCRIRMNDKKAAKKIIKQAKKHPEWYTQQDVKYAKMIKRKFKLMKHKRKEKENDF